MSQPGSAFVSLCQTLATSNSLFRIWKTLPAFESFVNVSLYKRMSVFVSSRSYLQALPDGIRLSQTLTAFSHIQKALPAFNSPSQPLLIHACLIQHFPTVSAPICLTCSLKRWGMAFNRHCQHLKAFAKICKHLPATDSILLHLKHLSCTCFLSASICLVISQYFRTVSARVSLTSSR